MPYPADTHEVTFRFRVEGVNKKWSPPLTEKEIVDLIWKRQILPTTRISAESSGKIYEVQERFAFRDAFGQMGVACNPLPTAKPAPKQKLTAEQIAWRALLGMFAMAMLVCVIGAFTPGRDKTAEAAAISQEATSHGKRAWLQYSGPQPFVQSVSKEGLEYLQNYRYTFPDKETELARLVDGNNIMAVEDGDGKEVEVLESTPMLTRIRFADASGARGDDWWVETEHVTNSMPYTPVYYDFRSSRSRGSSGRRHYSRKYGR